LRPRSGPARRLSRPRRRPARAAALLHADHMGDGRLALELRAAGGSRDVGGRGGDAVNRVADVVGAALGLVGGSPVLGLAALAVMLEVGVPVLFWQYRVVNVVVGLGLLK